MSAPVALCEVAGPNYRRRRDDAPTSAPAPAHHGKARDDDAECPRQLQERQRVAAPE